MTLQELKGGIAKLIDPTYSIDGEGRCTHCDEIGGKAWGVINFLADKGACFLDDAQTLPAIPDFGYDKEEYRPYLKRGAINYTKMLNDFKRVVSLKSMIENE